MFWVYDKSSLYSFQIETHFAKQISERLANVFPVWKRRVSPELFTKCTNRETVKSRSEPSKVFLLAPVWTSTLDERTQDILWHVLYNTNINIFKGDGRQSLLHPVLSSFDIKRHAGAYLGSCNAHTHTITNPKEHNLLIICSPAGDPAVFGALYNEYFTKAETKNLFRMILLW